MELTVQHLVGNRRVFCSCLVEVSNVWIQAPFRMATGSLLNYKLHTLRDHFLPLAYQGSTHYHRNSRAFDSEVPIWSFIAWNILLIQLEAH